MSRRDWPLVRLGEVLTQAVRAEQVDPSREYRLLGVRLEGLGPFRRETVSGSQTAATKLFVVKTGDFIYSRLFACRGAFGVIGPELDGCYVSGEFPVFIPDSDRLDVEFLRYWFRLPQVIARVDADCTGSTPLTRNRFNERFFRLLEFPLPPLAEQRRVVARIAELATAISEAQMLRKQADGETRSLFAARKRQVFEQARKHGETLLEDAFKRVSNGRRFDKASVQATGTVPVLSQSEKDVLGYHDGVPSVGAENLPLVTFANHTCAVRYVDFPFSTIQNVFLMKPVPGIEARYFYHFLHGRVQQEFYGGHWYQVGLLKIPVPPVAEQRRIVAELDAVQTAVDSLGHVQAGVAAELEVVLPAILDRAFEGELL